MKGCCILRSSKSQAIVCHIGRSRGAGGVGRGKSRTKLFEVFSSPSFYNTLLFHDSAPEECRLPWKPFLGPLVRRMSGLLSLERLWQGKSRECFGDGLHFCRTFIGVYSLPPLWSCAGSAGCIPREPEGPPAPGTEIPGLLLTLP